MVKIDLITGFLGSGKTTFLRKYASYLITQGQNIGILENDFGAVNVDMMLLGELRGDNCELEMISGGCDADTHRRRFKTKLISMGMCGYDRVIVEPSGIYDVDEFFDTLHEEPLDGWYQIGNVITVLDSNLEENLPEGADFLLASQAANAGCIILSKTQETTEPDQKNAVDHLNRALEKIGCKRQFDKVFAKDWDKLTDEDGDPVTLTDEEALGIINIRYTMGFTAYQKYMTTTIASNVSRETMTDVLENSADLKGVAIEETTLRVYNDSVYFAPIIGYTGKVWDDELEKLKETNPDYELTDLVGKTGIEASMEPELQGKKGSQTMYVNSTGRIVEIVEKTDPKAGNDVYLTIDRDLQIGEFAGGECMGEDDEALDFV